MQSFKQVWRRQEVRQDLRAFGVCSLAVVMLVTGAFSLAYLSHVFAGHAPSRDAMAPVNTEYYVSSFEP